MPPPPFFFWGRGGPPPGTGGLRGTPIPALQGVAPPGEQRVDGGRADDRLGRDREVRRVQDERPRLGSAEPAMEGDQLLERAPLLVLGVVEAADGDVGDVREGVRAQQVTPGGG
jgi:hypothetical protein